MMQYSSEIHQRHDAQCKEEGGKKSPGKPGAMGHASVSLAS